MTDPRNIAHDKKVQQEKKHRHQEIAPGAAEMSVAQVFAELSGKSEHGWIG